MVPSSYKYVNQAREGEREGEKKATVKALLVGADVYMILPTDAYALLRIRKRRTFFSFFLSLPILLSFCISTRLFFIMLPCCTQLPGQTKLL